MPALKGRIERGFALRNVAVDVEPIQLPPLQGGFKRWVGPGVKTPGSVLLSLGISPTGPSLPQIAAKAAAAIGQAAS